MNFRQVTELTPEQVHELGALYGQAWWTQGRTLDDIEAMLKHSDYIFAAVEKSTGALGGFARVLTDRIYKAFIFDMIVVPDHRGCGLGGQLMDWIVGHPDLQRVKHFELYCLPEMFSFYATWGFSADVQGIQLMRRAR
ncbi:MAG: GNAT family N-acetyltransferase [Phycisphaeraceae bacterium]